MPRYEYPSLRQGLVFAACPSLGASGLSLIDRSGRNNHGTLVNMAGQNNWRGNGSGVALSLDGVDDSLSVGRIPEIESRQQFSVSLWCSFVQVSGVQYALFSYGATGVFTSDILFGYISNSYLIQLNNGSDGGNTWSATVSGMNHYCVVFDGNDSVASNRVSLFINGRIVSGSGSFSYPATTSTSSSFRARWGNYESSSNWPLPGQLDDMRLYNRVLTPAEIRLLSSRRGIGLTPLPDRGGGLPRKLSVNVGGAWRSADAYVRTATDWRLSQASVNVDGTWK